MKEQPNEEQPLIQKIISEDQGDSNKNDGIKTSSSSAILMKNSYSYQIIVISYVAYSLNTGVIMAILPPERGWRLYSWHPLLMVLGVIGMMGIAISTKKLEGYRNTKLHAIITSLGLLMAYGGLYAIYKNKELHGKPHFTSLHSILGLVTLAGFTMSALAGLIFLHPDVGVARKDAKKR